MHVPVSRDFWIWFLSLASILFMLMRPWRTGEAIWIGAGAILLIVFRLISPRLAAQAVSKGTDVYFFLTGMMLLAELARHEGVFQHHPLTPKNKKALLSSLPTPYSAGGSVLPCATAAILHKQARTKREAILPNFASL